MIEINFRNLLIGGVNRLRYIRRYGTSLVLHPENVAEHSYYVAMYGLVIAEWVNDNANVEVIVNREKIMLRALLHDVDECVSGDIQRPFKYEHGELMKALLKSAALTGFNDTIEGVFGKEAGYILFRYSQEWQEDKDKTPEGRIIAFADYLAVVSYLWMESRSVSQTMAVHYESMRKHIAYFQDPSFDFIRPLVTEVEGIVEKIMEKLQND